MKYKCAEEQEMYMYVLNRRQQDGDAPSGGKTLQIRNAHTSQLCFI
jgi:hypothetical protein